MACRTTWTPRRTRPQTRIQMEFPTPQNAVPTTTVPTAMTTVFQIIWTKMTTVTAYQRRTSSVTARSHRIRTMTEHPTTSTLMTMATECRQRTSLATVTNHETRTTMEHPTTSIPMTMVMACRRRTSLATMTTR